MLDRLVGGSVLADTDRVVTEHENDLGSGQRGQAHGRAHVVEEHEERATDRQDAAVTCHADHQRAHAVLADAVVRLSPAGRLGGLGRGVRQLGAGVAGQVGRSGDQPGEVVDAHPQHLGDRLTCGDVLTLLERRQRAVPADDAGRGPCRIPRVSLRRLDRLECLLPPFVIVRAPFGGELAVRGHHVRRGPERLVRDADDGLRLGDVLGVERVAVGLVVVGELRRRVPDVRAQDEQARPVLDGLGGEQRFLEGVAVVGDLAEVLDVPAVGREPLTDVVRRARAGSGRRS